MGVIIQPLFNCFYGKCFFPCQPVRILRWSGVHSTKPLVTQPMVPWRRLCCQSSLLGGGRGDVTGVPCRRAPAGEAAEAGACGGKGRGSGQARGGRAAGRVHGRHHRRGALGGVWPVQAARHWRCGPCLIACSFEGLGSSIWDGGLYMMNRCIADYMAMRYPGRHRPV